MRKYLIVLIGILAISLMTTAGFAADKKMKGDMNEKTAEDMFSAMDDNSDNSISRVEWFQYMTSDEYQGTQRDVFFEKKEGVDWDEGMTKKQYDEEMYKQYDVDKDEQISREEWKKARDRDYKAFDEADVNRDERVSRDEYLVETYGAMDLNRDSRVSREEWFEFMEGQYGDSIGN